MNGLTVARVAATSPAARDTSSRPHRYVIGITMVPSRADSDRRPTSPVPNTLAHSHASDEVQRRGGLVDVDLVQHRAERQAHLVDRRGFVEPVALARERAEAESGADRDQNCNDPDVGRHRLRPPGRLSPGRLIGTRAGREEHARPSVRSKRPILPRLQRPMKRSLPMARRRGLRALRAGRLWRRLELELQLDLRLDVGSVAPRKPAAARSRSSKPRRSCAARLRRPPRTWTCCGSWAWT